MDSLEQDATPAPFTAVKVAAIGPASAAALARYGIRADLVADTATSAGLASAMIESGIAGRRVLLPRSDIAGSVLPDRLRSSGASVKEVVCYRTVVPESSGNLVRNALRDGVDAVTFTSSSTVRNLLRLLENDVAMLDSDVHRLHRPRNSRHR